MCVEPNHSFLRETAERQGGAVQCFSSASGNYCLRTVIQ